MEQSVSIPFPSALASFLSVQLMVLFLFGCGVKYGGPRQTSEGIIFSVKAPQAKKVSIAGNFNEWDTERDVLKGPDESGMWNITLPLSEGRHEYLFWVDGEKWVLDPDVPFADDGLGGKNSIVTVR